MMRVAEGFPRPFELEPNEEGAMPRIYSIRPTLSLKGRRFQGLRGFTGKPFHPPLTDFPIVCYTLAAVFDLISYFSSSTVPAIGDATYVAVSGKARDFFVAATFVMVSGYIVSLGAALTGFMDWWKGIPRDRKSGPIGKAKHTQVWRTINWHATVMLTVTAITLIDIILRVSDFERGHTSGLWLALSVIAAGGVLFGSSYGGTLVFEYGFNVENVDEVWKESEVDHFPGDKPGSTT